MLLNEAYSMLQLNSDATLDDVKKAFRKMGKIYHPDNIDGDAEKFRLLKNAKTIAEAEIRFGRLFNSDKRGTYIVRYEDFLSNRRSSTMKLVTGEIVETKDMLKHNIYLVFTVTIVVRMVEDGSEQIEEYTNEIFKEHRIEGRYTIDTQIEVDRSDIFKEKDVSVEVLGVKSEMHITSSGSFYLRVAENSLFVTVECKPIKNEDSNNM